MLEAKNFPADVQVQSAATAAAIAACDELDGVKDGVIDDPVTCTYDPKSLVGTSNGDCGTITEADAAVIRKIWDGPRRTDGTVLWYGLPRGADFGGLSGTQGNPPVGRPNPITLEWFRFFLTQESTVGLDDDQRGDRTNSSGISRSNSSAPSLRPIIQT